MGLHLMNHRRQISYCCMVLSLLPWFSALSLAQDATDSSGQANSAASAATPTLSELQRLANEAAANRAAPPAPQPADVQGSSLNVLELLREGGGIMVVIGIISLLVVAVAFERLFALRRGKLYPGGLRREVRKAVDAPGEFQPQVLFDSASRYRCVASRILKDMLQKVGRPIPEVEAAVAEASQREADRLYSNVRWLTLAAAVSPLIGLLGTVWGMIIAFHDTTQLGAGSNRAEYLAEGIYVALVTTLGGLVVAIPAAIFAHFFEGRIMHMIALIDSELRWLIPRFEVLEGRVRYDLSPQRRLVPRSPAPPVNSDASLQASGPRGTALDAASLANAHPTSHPQS